MKRRWFTPWGLVYLPVSFEGYLVTLLALAFSAQVFWAVDSHSHSVSDTLYGIYPFWGVTFLGLMFIASRTSGEEPAD